MNRQMVLTLRVGLGVFRNRRELTLNEAANGGVVPPLERKDHDRLNLYTVAARDRPHQVAPSSQLRTRIHDPCVIDVAQQSMPHKTCTEFLKRNDVTAQRTALIGCPSAIKMESVRNFARVPQPSAQLWQTKKIVISRTIVEREVIEPRILEVAAGREIDSYERADIAQALRTIDKSRENRRFLIWRLGMSRQVANHDTCTPWDRKN